MCKILLVDDHPAIKVILRAYLSDTQYSSAELTTASDCNAAVEALRDDEFDLIFLDNRLPPHFNYRASLEAFEESGWDGKVVLLTGEQPSDFGNDPLDDRVIQVMLKDNLNPQTLSHLLSLDK